MRPRTLALAVSAALFLFVALHFSPERGTVHKLDFENVAHGQAAFSVTPNDFITWNLIAGAHYDVILLDANPGSLLTPPGTVDVGATNEVAVSALLGSRSAGTYYVRVRSKNPDGSLPSAYSVAVEFTYAGFAVPDGIAKKP